MTSTETNNSTFLQTVNDIETYLSENKDLKQLYESAQQILTNEKRIDNDKYIECIKRCNVLIKYLVWIVFFGIALAGIVNKMILTSTDEKKSMGSLGKKYASKTFDRDMLIRKLDSWLKEYANLYNSSLNE